MISYQVKKKKNKFISIEVSGHALFDKHGKDIVCASVSTAIVMTINQIEIFHHFNQVEYEISEARFVLKVKNFNDDVDKILKNLEYTLNDLKGQYPKHVTMLQGG